MTVLPPSYFPPVQAGLSCWTLRVSDEKSDELENWLFLILMKFLFTSARMDDLMFQSGVWTRRAHAFGASPPSQKPTAEEKGSREHASRTAHSLVLGSGVECFPEGQVSTPGAGFHSPGPSTPSVTCTAHRRAFQEDLWLGCSQICSWLVQPCLALSKVT